MKLVRRLVLRGLHYNFRIFAQYIESEANDLADLLSRGQMQRFFEVAPSDVCTTSDPIPAEFWPVEKLFEADF